MLRRFRYLLGNLVPPQGDGFDRTRNLILVESCLTSALAAITTGAFLTGFLKQRGMSDAMTAVMVQLPLLMSVIQLLSPVFFERKQQRLPYLRGCVVSFRLLVSLAFLFTPFLPFGSANVYIFIGMYLLGYMIGYFSDPCYLDFLSTSLPNNIRAPFLALRDMLLVAIGTGISLLFGVILDHSKSADNGVVGFLAVGVMALCCTLGLLFVYLRMKQPPTGREPAHLKLRESLVLPFKDKAYRRYMLTNCLYTIGFCFNNAFVSLYLFSLGLGYTYVLFIALINTVARLASARPVTRLMQRIGVVKVVSFSILLYSVALFVTCATTRSNYAVLQPLSGLLTGLAMAGINLGLFTMNTQSAPEKNRTSYFSMNACLAPMTGLLAGLSSAFLCEQLKEKTWNFAGLPVGNMQTIFLCSSLFLLLVGVVILYLFRHFGSDSHAAPEASAPEGSSA